MKQILRSDEVIRYVGKLHWVVYSAAINAFVFFVVLLIIGLTSSNENVSGWCYIGALIMAITSLCAAVKAWIRRRTTEIVATDKRIVLKVGLLSRRTIELNLAQVESVDVRQSLWGRVFDYGDILVRGTGTSMEPLALVANPIELRNAIAT